MSVQERFLNKVVIVTGAAQGIGRGVALQVASEGAQVVLADLSDFVEETLAEIEAQDAMRLLSKPILKLMQALSLWLPKPLKLMVVLMYSSTMLAVQFG